jgi:hypothetical protein
VREAHSKEHRNEHHAGPSVPDTAPNNENGIAAAIVQGDGRAVAIPIAVIVLTIVTAVVIRRRLSRSYRRELDAHPLPSAR